MCNCVRDLEEKLGATALFSDNLNKEMSIPFMKKVDDRMNVDDFIHRRVEDILINAKFCPFCGEEYKLGEI